MPLRERLAALVQRIGERPALALLRVSRPTLGRAMSGLPVYGVTHEVIRRVVEEERHKGGEGGA